MQNIDGKKEEILEWLREQVCNHLDITIAFADDDATSSCESPIEHLMFMAMSATLVFRMIERKFLGETVKVWCGGKECKYAPPASDPWADTPYPEREINFLFSQAAVGKYRADFIVHRVAKDAAGLVRHAPPVVIECDGHDFHERTKDQAQHDKERDRWLQAQGYVVLRFTGSEVWRDPIKCAAQVDKFLDDRMK